MGAVGARARASGLAVAMVVGVLITTGCSSGSDDVDAPTQGSPSKKIESSSERIEGVDTDVVIGELKGPNGIEVAVHSAVRDESGFVTVNGTLKNTGDRTFRAAEWQSGETSIRSKSSIAGATLVDKEGKKRYMVLRDTDGQCLCSTGLAGVKSGETRPVFAQFPAPPSTVTEVEFQVPSMSPTTLQITEG